MRPPEIVIAIGLALIFGAVTWRVFRAAKTRRRITGLLRSDDPVQRSHALDILGERGLRSHAKHLLEMSMSEENPDVRAALLTAIARTQWEPVDHTALIELRAWARARTSETRATEPALDSPTGPPARTAARTPRENRPLRVTRQGRDRSVVDRLERILNEPILAVRLESLDGTVEVDVQLQEEVNCA